MTHDTIDQARLDRLERLTTPRLTRYIAHRPTPPQTAFLLLDCREAMYGGAAGGGKSDALLMAALQYVNVPDYAALLLRKSYSDLSQPAALIPRAHEWLAGTDAKWNGAEHVWRFPSGASLSFGYLTPRPTSIATSQRSTSSSASMNSPSFPSRSTLICFRGFDGSKAQACRCACEAPPTPAVTGMNGSNSASSRTAAREAESLSRPS